ncbi:MAG TPA: hypothetical protein VJS39_06260, partial [Gemmatimonadaceae bacterium]|nr:hypothetical protein [Gemmatimonadaceae bacterium]
MSSAVTHREFRIGSCNSRKAALREVVRLGLVAVCLVPVSFASAQQLTFRGDSVGADTAAGMSALASQTMAIYHDTNRDRYLDNLFRLQMVSGKYGDASRAL